MQKAHQENHRERMQGDTQLKNGRPVLTFAFICWQRESVVDLTWASPATANQIYEWKVLEDLETLSNHFYIGIRLR